jgi:hypothetical protein
MARQVRRDGECLDQARCGRMRLAWCADDALWSGSVRPDGTEGGLVRQVWLVRFRTAGRRMAGKASGGEESFGLLWQVWIGKSVHGQICGRARQVRWCGALLVASS